MSGTEAQRTWKEGDPVIYHDFPRGRVKKVHSDGTLTIFIPELGDVTVPEVSEFLRKEA